MSTDVFLRIGISSSQLSVRKDGESQKVQDLRLGTGLLAAQCFRHAPPTAIETEQAIDTVEDAIMPLAPLHEGYANLYNHDTLTMHIAEIAGATDGFMSINQLERVFERFAAIALGRPTTQDVIPKSAAFAAQLIILREVMHHLDFNGIQLSGGPTNRQ